LLLVPAILGQRLFEGKNKTKTGKTHAGQTVENRAKRVGVEEVA